MEEERPSSSAAIPMPSATNSVRATKVLVLLVSATSWNTLRSTSLPIAITPPKPSVALAATTQSGSLPPCPASNGSTTSRGATARSCSSSTERAAVPSGLPSHPFALSAGSTNAEDDSAPAAPSTKASTGF